MILSFTGSSLSHIIVVLPHIMEFPLVMQIWRNKIYDESYIGFHCSEVQTEVFVLNKKSQHQKHVSVSLPVILLYRVSIRTFRSIHPFIHAHIRFFFIHPLSCSAVPPCVRDENHLLWLPFSVDHPVFETRWRWIFLIVKGVPLYIVFHHHPPIVLI